MQPTPRYQCERLISVILTRCNCMMKPSVFDRITDPKGRWTSRKLYSLNNLPAATFNMVSKDKQVRERESDSSDSEFTRGLK